MKMFMSIELIAGVFLLLASCTKDNSLVTPPPPPPSDTSSLSNLEILWQTPHYPDTSARDVIQLDELYLGSPLFELVLNLPGARYQLFDGITGNMSWEWNEQKWIKTSYGKGHGSWNHLFIANDWSQRIAIDMNTGQTAWHTQIDDPDACGQPRIGIFGDYIYHSVNECNGQHRRYAFIERTHISTLAKDSVFFLHQDDVDGYSPDFESFGMWINPLGDSILFFQSRMIRWDGQNDDRVDVFALNLQNKEVVWSHTDIEPSGGSSIWDPIVWDDKFYFQGSGTLFCFDASTGEILWTHYFNHLTEHLGATKSIIRNGKLYVHPEGNTLYCMDALTGDILWKNDKVGGAPSHELQYHNGIIYWAWDALWAVDAETGETLWKEYSPNFSWARPAGFSNNGVLIDHDRGILFTSDRYFAMAIKCIR